MQRPGAEPWLIQRRGGKRFAQSGARAHRMAQHRLARRRARLANRFEPVAADAACEGRSALRAPDQPAIAARIWNQCDRSWPQLSAAGIRLEAEELRRL